MAEGVRVYVTDKTVIQALNTPGGAVYDWREAVLKDLKYEFDMTSPEGDPRNRTHDRGFGGNYQRAQWFNRHGNGTIIGIDYGNDAFYAENVEFGRLPTAGYEKFAWSRHTPPGSIRLHREGTMGYDGMHIQRDICNTVMPRHCDGYTPLP